MNKVFRYLPLIFITPLTLASCSGSISSLKNKRNGQRVTDIQYAYLSSENIADTSPYNGNMSVSAPNPIRLSWSGQNIKEYKVNIYSDEDLKNLVVSYKTGNTHYDFYNDELNKTYYWTISSSDGTSKSKASSFVYNPTISQPRNLYIDGVENFRDIGGWGAYSEANGYKNFMKQGMIYRSGRFNEYDDEEEKSVNTITKKGIYELKNHLKIKTEIDLRRSSTNETGGITSSVLGSGVRYVNLPMYFGGQNILTYTGKPSGDSYRYDNPVAIKSFFEILADENNYPINFHCSIGKDRTGCLAYLIEGLMGFSQEIMYRDYMFTNFSNAGMCKLQDDIINRYGATLNNYEGETIANKVYNYLSNVVGISTSNLDAIINILK